MGRRAGDDGMTTMREMYACPGAPARRACGIDGSYGCSERKACRRRNARHAASEGLTVRRTRHRLNGQSKLVVICRLLPPR